EPGPPRAVALRRQPGDAQRGEERVVTDRERPLEPRVAAPPAPLAPRRRNRDDVVARGGDLRRTGPRDPVLEHPALEAARRVEQEDDALAVGRRPAVRIFHRRRRARERSHGGGLYPSTQAGGKTDR